MKLAAYTKIYRQIQKVIILPVATVLLAQGAVGYADPVAVAPPDVESVLRVTPPDKAIVPRENPKVGATPNENPPIIGDIILINNSGINDAVIRLQMDALKPGDYITEAKLERSLLLINDLAGARAKITPKPGKEVGTIDLIVEITPVKKLANFALSMNNVGNAEYGTNQIGLAGGFSNISGIGDKLSFRSITTGQDLGGAILVYQRPGFTSGSQFIFYTFKLRYTLGGQRSYLNAYGAVNGIHAGWNYYLHRSRDFNLQFQSGWEYKQRQDTINLIHQEADKTMHNVIAGLVGDSNDSWAGGGNNSFSIMYNKGRLIMDTGYAQYADTQYQSAGDFDRWKYSFIRQQYIAKRLSGTFSFNGQYTDKNLEISQQLAMSGINGVRAYPQGEVSGNKGWLARCEVKWAMTPSQKGREQWQLVGFYDAGKAEINAKPWPGVTDNSIFLRGTGIGINWNDPGKRSIKISYAWKVGHVPAKFATNAKGYLWIQTVSYL